MINKALAGLAVLFKQRRPIKVAHYITYRCNLSCDMCGRKDIPSQKELDTEGCKALQKEFRRHGTVVWSFSGGECLLRPDIIELSRHAKEIGLDLIIVTNGMLLPKKMEITEYADVLNISIDGNRETHDRLRGVGNFDKVIQALEGVKANRRKKMKLVINTILNNETIEHLDYMLELVGRYDAELGFNPAIVHRSDLREISALKYLPSHEQYRNFIAWLEEKKKTGEGARLFDEPAFFRKVGHYPDKPTPIPCYGGFFQCSIDPFGKVLPCSDYFDFPEEYEKMNQQFGYGYEGFKQLPKKFPCGYQFCCTAKKNFFFDNPGLILKHFVAKK